jgi:hypothetical protein
MKIKYLTIRLKNNREEIEMLPSGVKSYIFSLVNPDWFLYLYILQIWVARGDSEGFKAVRFV